MQCTHQTCSRLNFADMGKVYRTMMNRVGPSHWNVSSGQITARQVIEGVHISLSLWSSMKSPKATITIFVEAFLNLLGIHIFEVGATYSFGFFCCTFVKPKKTFNNGAKGSIYQPTLCQTLQRNHPLTFVVVSILLCFLQGATQHSTLWQTPS